MSISPDILGASAGPRVVDIEARWLMAYAAALGATAPEYLDTTRSGSVVGHPLFPVCYEWPLALELRARTLSQDIALRGVHVSHDLTLHRPLRAGDRLTTTATIARVEARSSGAYIVTHFETTDALGRPVSTTHYGSIYRGVECEGPAPLSLRGRGQGRGDEQPGDEEPPDWSTTVPIPATLAHVYSECARIWNPIHTDRAVALAAGLPDIILHGTATLALAVSEVLRRDAASATQVRRIICRFGGMVGLPSTITLQGWQGREGDGRRVAFQAITVEGRPALKNGCVVLAP